MDVLNPGDSIRIKGELTLPNECPYIVGDMNDFRGRIVHIDDKIVKCSNSCRGRYHCYKIKEDKEKGSYIWSDRWFEPAEKRFIKISEDKAILLAGDNGKTRVERKVSLAEMMRQIALEQQNSSTNLLETPVLPSGTRFYFKKGNTEVVVVEQAPQARTILVNNQKTYTIALPYVAYLFLFINGIMPPHGSRIFYRTSPISSVDDSLLMCNLTHVNTEEEHFRIGAVCMQAPFSQDDPLEKKIAASLGYFWDTDFKVYEQDKNAGNFFTGFAKSSQLDLKISTIDSWQAASILDPLFVLSVPWIETGLSIRHVVDEMFQGAGSTAGNERVDIKDASGLADMMYRIKEAEDV